MKYFFDPNTGQIKYLWDSQSSHYITTVARAKKDWENVGTIVDCNIAFRRLAIEFEWDVARALKWYKDNP